MYWCIALLWFIGGSVLFWSILSSKWNRMDALTRSTLRFSRIFHSVPGYPSYLDLKLSMLRHAIFFLISAIIIYFTDWEKNDFISNTILFLNLLYCGLSIFRYRGRKRELAKLAADPEQQCVAEMIAIPIKDSFCVVVHAALCPIIVTILFIIKP